MTGKKIVVGLLSLVIVVSGFFGVNEIGYSNKETAREQGKLSSGQVQQQSEAKAANASPISVQQMTLAKQEDSEVSSNTPEEIQAFAGMELVAKNDSLQLYVNRQTAEIAVKEIRNGYIWFSNPPGRNEDTKASPLYKSELSAQVLVTYYNEKGQINAFNSYDDSVAKKQFEITAQANGVKIVYQIGNHVQSFANIPKAISKKRFETKIIDQIADKDKSEDIAYKFRFDEQKQIYEVRKLQDYVAEELSATLEAAGYTAEDAALDNKENGAAEGATGSNAEFTIPVNYSLDGEYLVVSVPNKEVKFNPAYPIATLQILKYFGAAGTKQAGYMFVPDGAGALIHLNNGKQNAEPYQVPVYGRDGTYDVKEQIQSNAITRLPVFGLKQNDHAFLGMIEDGDAMASISADVSGRNDSYNSISSKFQVVAMDFYTLSSGTKTSSVPMFQSQTYAGNLQLRYAFLSGGSSDYVGMAQKYRTYLVNKYQLKPLTASDDSPFMLELEGAFRKSKSFLGIPYESTESLTSFSEAQSLLQKLKKANIHSIDLRYVGWFNDGIRHSSPADIQIAGALGGKSGFEKLADYARQNKIGFYPDVAFLEKYKGAAGSATFLDRSKAKVYNYNPVMYVKDLDKFSHYILSPSKLSAQVQGFLADYGNLGGQGLSMRDLGNEVNSDFDPDHTIVRQDAMKIITTEFEKLKKQAGSLMVNGGNVYSLPYAASIINAPTKSSQLNITDEDIPFYQIVLHGYFDLAGAPFNMDENQNPQLSMLKALETGSNIYYQWYYSDAIKVKDTAFNNLYALSYENWFDQAVQLYSEANKVLKTVRNHMIVSHRKEAPGVVQTTFDNGITLTINYNNSAVVVNGLEIGAQSYQVGGE
ncbi:hypothetical protein Back11_19860 [Paenibacillus baekrokdamisoli]|uniref:Uncharacterized protein n=1 Tax=Paenibacillus baekrokdamisoli TaxID=1712516 RepID=A0A3G9J4C1_9BACL|nr:DUF5696 domain-containing protein [Paenibacillus baekrokdamisoli]MBB3070010.1 hypothetical protein [Paenibacillus baekrokdamisoli]BBH20641.1 hypothetical protein Back11_19860 [Paenibacillus baekrokdamisoli]